MKWWEFIETGKKLAPKKRIKIVVRQFGIQKLIIVRTKGNNQL